MQILLKPDYPNHESDSEFVLESTAVPNRGDTIMIKSAGDVTPDVAGDVRYCVTSVIWEAESSTSVKPSVATVKRIIVECELVDTPESSVRHRENYAIYRAQRAA